jgi:hypothetical protein
VRSQRRAPPDPEAKRPLRRPRLRYTFTWAESLYYLLHSGVMSEAEQEWVFGKALRQIVRWEWPGQIR